MDSNDLNVELRFDDLNEMNFTQLNELKAQFITEIEVVAKKANVGIETIQFYERKNIQQEIMPIYRLVNENEE